MKKINEKIRESWMKGNIDDKTKDYLIVSEDVKPGRFYLLPKIHKLGCPSSPVILGCGTLTEKILSIKTCDHLIHASKILKTFYTSWKILASYQKERCCVQ